MELDHVDFENIKIAIRAPIELKKSQKYFGSE